MILRRAAEYTADGVLRESALESFRILFGTLFLKGFSVRFRDGAVISLGSIAEPSAFELVIDEPSALSCYRRSRTSPAVTVSFPVPPGASRSRPACR